MSSDPRLSPRDRRVVLEQLSRGRLSELTAKFELDVDDRRSSDSHIDAIVRKRSLDFGEVLEILRREELQSGCEALGLDTSGREKAKLIRRILRVDRVGVDGDRGLAQEVRTVDGDIFRQGGAGEEAVSEPASSAEAAIETETQSAGRLKSELRRFVLDVAGGYRGREAAGEFVSRLLRCFGWPGGHAPEAAVPATLSIVANGARSDRAVALFWNTRRVLIEVVKHDVMLDYAWKDLLRLCLQVDPVPQYVLLTNQRDLHLYDLVRDREAPRLSIAVDDLPKYSEAFPFLGADWKPGMVPKIINVSKVSGEVAGLVARLFRSLKDQHPERERDVVQFTLQCILTMFAEDIGLLPQEYFTSLLYDGARGRDVEQRLGDLFRLMSTRDVPSPRAIPFFNGGLFKHPVTLPLGDAQLAALTKASEANWSYVDPHIFGSVFQGIMNDAERHKSGAHYTAHDDIMRIVGPTIVEPWRQRIRTAKTLSELLEVRAGLLKFRVLDPACGSGNFLYVAFREMYRLDTELLARLREFPSTQGDGKAKVTWGVGIQTANFFGIDINPFAVELAKVTLNIAKKIAFDERYEVAGDLGGQLEIDVDPSLPLDNLDKNIVCADALFTDWPEVEAIVGNPPILGDRKIRGALGADYIRRLQATSGLDGVVDLSCYWFRRAHDRLPTGARAGLVATSGIRIGKAREASLDYIVANGGTLTNAVSSRLWPGDAALNVSMVNWVKGPSDGPHHLIVEDQVFPVDRLSTHLDFHSDLSKVRKIVANRANTAMGVIFGSDAFRAASPKNPIGFRLPELRGLAFVKPVATGDDMLRGVMATDPDYCIHLLAENEDAAEKVGGAAFAHLKTHVHSMVKKRAETGEETHHYERWLRTWWQPREPSRKFFAQLATKRRMIACSNPQARPIFAFLSTIFVPTNTMQIFAFDDDYSYGVIQSVFHWQWARAKGGRVTERIRYTNDVWSTFPWPQEPTEREVADVAAAAQDLRRVRDTLMTVNGWSLRALYQAAEVPGRHPLKDAQAALDDVIRAAYGMPADQDGTEFLLELNNLLAQDEAEGRPVQGPGVPRGLDPRDPRWNSDDCIEAPRS